MIIRYLIYMVFLIAYFHVRDIEIVTVFLA